MCRDCCSCPSCVERRNIRATEAERENRLRALQSEDEEVDPAVVRLGQGAVGGVSSGWNGEPQNLATSFARIMVTLGDSAGGVGN